MFSNKQVAQLLRNVAVVLDIKKENRFRIIAYQKAADAIEYLTEDLFDIWKEGKLSEVSGIGSGIAQSLEELFKKGKVEHFEEIISRVSPALFELLLVPGIGPKKAFRLTEIFDIKNPKTAVSELEKIAQAGKIASLEGFGEKSQELILSGIDTYKKGQIKENKILFAEAERIAQEIIAYLEKDPHVKRIDMLGSLRRKAEMIGDIDLGASSENPQALIQLFVQYPKKNKIIDQGEKGATIILNNGKQVDIRVQKPDAYGAMLQYFSGNKFHNIALREFALKKGLSLSEHGIKNVKTEKLEAIDTEEHFYKKLGLPWIPPEIRENRGEIEAALNNTLPKLVEQSDISGDVHIHTNLPYDSAHDQGSGSIEELLEAGHKLGYAFMGFSDHNPSVSTHSAEKIIALVKKRSEEIHKRAETFLKKYSTKMNVFSLMEVDILADGKRALPDEALDHLDAIIVSIHSSFNLSADEMTQRIISGLSHPKAKIFAHPSGRLLNKREPYQVDWKKLFEFAAKHEKALEINSSPDRMDLKDSLINQAVQQGVKLIINTDSHDVNSLMNIRYGVNNARRGWAEKKDILNTLPVDKFVYWLMK